MNEAQLKVKVLWWLKEEFPEGFFYKTSDRFTIGIPDIIGCIKGRMIAIELKVKGGKVTQLQQYILNKISNAGALTGICYSLADVKNFLMAIRYI